MAVEKKAEKTPKKYKGFSKLPEAVQKKIDPDLANKYVKGGRVSFKSRRERQKAQAKPAMTKPRPSGLGALSTSSKPTTFTGKINTETQKLQNIDGKTVVVNKSNESGRSISDADRARVGKMMGGFGKKKLKGMEKGGQVAGPKKYTKKKKPKSFVDLIKFSDTTGKEYQKDKVTKSGKRLGGFNKGGLVKGGTSSQMTGREYKGIF